MIKKLGIALGSVIAILLLVMFLIPVFFKDDIKKAMDDTLASSIKADVYYDASSFDLSLFSNFPDLTVSLQSFGITGRDIFKEDTLVAIQAFGITIDLFSLFSDQITIEQIRVVSPKIQILVMEDGQANYDIAFPDEVDTATVETDKTSEPFKLAIKKWEIVDADIVYYDLSLPFYISLVGMNHTGSGNFAENIFDMVTHSSVEGLSLGYDGIEYISDKTLQADITMGMDLDQMKFIFKQNKALLNNLAVAFDGYIQMKEDMIFDLTFSGQEMDMKSILSLVPGNYVSYLQGVTASGTVNLTGLMKGEMTETEMPQMRFDFQVADGKINHTDAPVPLEKIALKATFDMPSADYSRAYFLLEEFHMEMAQQPFDAYLLFKDLNNYQWDFKMNGTVDFTQILPLLPLYSTELRGKFAGILATSGKMQDLEAERYDLLPTSGSFEIMDFYYASTLLPSGIGISKAKLSFDPKKIEIPYFLGWAGTSDFSLEGQVTQYLPYVLGDSVKLQGSLNLISKKLNVDEWLGDTETVEEEDTAVMEVVRIPNNLSILFAAKIDTILYDGLELTAFGGAVEVTDGSLALTDISCQIIGAKMDFGAKYNSIPESPTYSADFKLMGLSIPEAFSTFNTIKTMAPFAEKMEGKCNLAMSILGEMDLTMSPKYETMNGGGVISILEAKMRDLKTLQLLATVTNGKEKDGELTMKDVKVDVAIENGVVNVKPFDVRLAGYTTTISGSNQIAGPIAYLVKTKNVPTGAAGQAISGAVASLTGVQNAVSSKVDVLMGVEGTFTDPEIKIKGIIPAGSSDQGVAQSTKDLLSSKLTDQKEQLSQRAEDVKQQAKDTANAAIDSAKALLNQKKEETKDKATNAVKDLLKKKKGGGN